MNDGKIVQTLPSPGGLYSMGFLHGGRTVWTHGQGVTAFYDVRAQGDFEAEWIVMSVPGHWSKKRQSVPSAMILLGVDLINPASRSRSE